MDSNYTITKPNTLEKANILSKLFFVWFRKVCTESVKENYHIDDLQECSSAEKSTGLTNLLEGNWNYEVIQSRNKNKTPSLRRVLWKTYSGRYLLYGILYFFQVGILQPSQPILLSKLLHLFSERPSETEAKHHMEMMYIYGASIILVGGLSVFLNNHLLFFLDCIGMQIRIACSALIYRKILRLSKKSLDESSAGHVISLLSNDINRFDFLASFFNYLWISPLLLVISTAFVWYEMQIAGMVGLAIFILFIPFQGLAGNVIAKLRLKVAQKTDEKVKKLSEIFFGIRLIKMYAWENPFDSVIDSIRSQEVKSLKTSLTLTGVILCASSFFAKLAIFVTVTTYSLMGSIITAAQVFSVVLVLKIMQDTISLKLPLCINHLAETLVSVQRLQEFLLLEENELQPSSGNRGEISLKNIQISWKSECPVLSDISINVKPGSLCAIVGPVGVGKSSLLQLLLGELSHTRGSIAIGGKLAYVSQKPWIFASTVKRNILFGQKYNENHYQNIVNVCSLRRDFQLFPQGDETLVGEKGVTLSGGQKARINLARAVAREADIYLLDDPLSAVDAHVGKDLFENCIVGYLKGKTRVLVTHQLQYLKYVDHIVVLNDGQVEAQGTFEELSKINIDFTKLLIASESIPSEAKYKEVEDLKIETNNTTSDKIDEREPKYVAAEEMTSDANSRQSIFWQYIKSSNNKCVLAMVVLLFITTQVFASFADLWLTIWTNHEAINKSSFINITIPVETDLHPLLSNRFEFLSTKQIIYVYAAIILVLILSSIASAFFFYGPIISISRKLHNNMFQSVLYAPIKFFDIHPSGKILNRFSRDIGIVDQVLPGSIHMGLMIITTTIGSLVVIIIANPYMAIVIVLLAFPFNKLTQWYIAVAQNLKHIESTAKSPVYSYINATWNGILTIRATEMESPLKREFDGHQDTHTSAWQLYLTSLAAFGLWIDLLSWIFLLCVTFSFIIMNQYKVVSGSYAGLAVSQTSALAGTLQFGIEQIAHVISQMIAVKRILEFSKIDKEPSRSLVSNDIVPFWPSEGKIEFNQVFLKYSPLDAPVLKNLNFTINAREKIGIVGRTGAGKSSLISVLLRLTPIEGSIIIDGTDIEDLSLQNVRTKITIIPQDPILFSATIRYNLDPFNQFTDQQIWNALGDVELKSAVTSLDYLVDESGNNFSVGQRQLMCLARAILRKNKILVLDEATANIDNKTDELIQNTIRSKFNDCTVLTVAHRLHTIMDSTKVMVMDAGHLVEYDTPNNLLQNKNGYFYKMVSDSGLLYSNGLYTY